MDMFTAQIVAKVSQMYTYLQIHQVVHIKYVQLFVFNHCLNKVVYNK